MDGEQQRQRSHLHGRQRGGGQGSRAVTAGRGAWWHGHSALVVAWKEEAVGTAGPCYPPAPLTVFSPPLSCSMSRKRLVGGCAPAVVVVVVVVVCVCVCVWWGGGAAHKQVCTGVLQPTHHKEGPAQFDAGRLPPKNPTPTHPCLPQCHPKTPSQPHAPWPRTWCPPGRARRPSPG